MRKSVLEGKEHVRYGHLEAQLRPAAVILTREPSSFRDMSPNVLSDYGAK